MNDFESKIKESLEKEIEKYSPDDIEAVRKAASESGGRMKWSKLYIIAACLTFVILAGSLTGILLKTNGSGGFTDNSEAVSGGGYQENSQASDTGSEQVSEPISEPVSGPEETVTLAQKHPELALLPDGYSFEYFDSKNPETFYKPTGTIAKDDYLNYINPKNTEYISDSQPEELCENYIKVTIKNNEHSYVFDVYEDGYISLTFDPYSNNTTKPAEWYKNDPLKKIGKTFAENHPDAAEIPTFSSCSFDLIDEKGVSSFGTRNSEQIKLMLDNVTDDGKICCVQSDNFSHQNMHIQYMLIFNFLNKEDSVGSFMFDIYDNGYVRFIEMYADGSSYSEIYYNPNSYELPGLIGNTAFADKHSNAVPDIEAIIINNGKEVTGVETETIYSTITSNYQAKYFNGSIYSEENCIDLQVNIKDAPSQVFHVYENGFMTLTYQDGENKVTEVYYSGADIYKIDVALENGQKSFADKHPDRLDSNNAMMKIIGYSNGKAETNVAIGVQHTAISNMYSAIIGKGGMGFVDNLPGGELDRVPYVHINTYTNKQVTDVYVYQNGYLKILIYESETWETKESNAADYEYYYNPAGYDLETIFGEYVDLNQ